MPKPAAQRKPLEDVALGLLARREQSVVELRRKLLTRGYPRAEVEALITRLVETRAVDDARYAEARARSRAKDSKWGVSRIQQELALAGVEKGLARTTLTELEETHDWFEAARKLAARHFTTPLARPDGGKDAWEVYKKEKARRVGFLVRRGFTLQQALAALELDEHDERDDDSGFEEGGVELS